MVNSTNSSGITPGPIPAHTPAESAAPAAAKDKIQKEPTSRLQLNFLRNLSERIKTSGGEISTVRRTKSEQKTTKEPKSSPKFSRLFSRRVGSQNPAHTEIADPSHSASASISEMPDDKLRNDWVRQRVQQQIAGKAAAATSTAKTATAAGPTPAAAENKKEIIDFIHSGTLVSAKDMGAQSAAICSTIKDVIPESYAKLETLLSANKDKIDKLSSQGWKATIKELKGDKAQLKAYEKFRGDLVQTNSDIMKDLSLAMGYEKPFQFFSVGTPGYASDVDVTGAGPQNMDQEVQAFFHAASYAVLVDSLVTEKTSARPSGFTLDTEFYTQHTDFARPYEMKTTGGKTGVARINSDSIILQA
jgi:hypothetical protein